MADIFLSYRNTPDVRPIVRRLATLLQVHGFTVWWDYGLEAGKQFEQQILNEITAAGVVIPLWSEQSVSSYWVRREAELGVGHHLRAIERDLEQELDGRERCIERNRRHARLHKMQLQPSQVIGRDRLGRAPEKSSQAALATDVSLLSSLAHLTHANVLNHAVKT